MSFIGARHMEHEVGGFQFGHWFATSDVKPHGHDDAHFMFVIAGDYSTRLPGRSNLIFNPAGTFHADRFETAGSFFTLTVPEEHRDAFPRRATRIDSAATHALIARLMRECAAWCVDSASVAESICLEMLTGDAAQREPRWLTRAKAILGQEDVSIAQLARAVGVNPIHLTRSFRRFYRCTPGEYARSVRAARAARLLAASNLPLAEVAVESGFADQSHFTKIFRRAYGISPGNYRRSLF